MFNLELAIAEWRQQMLAVGIKTPGALDELESHLRDDVEQRMRLGAGAQEAFEIAVRQIGRPGALRKEFAKINRKTRLQRLKGGLLRFLGVSAAPPNAYTVGAREILELGGKEALGFHHDFIGTEHLLLGLLELKTEIVPTVLQRIGVDHTVVRAEIEKIVGVGLPQLNPSALRYTPRVKKALELAGEEARAQNRTRVSAEHIFLGLMLEGGGVAALVLRNLGVNAGSIRGEILKELGRNQPGD
jgi:hypothetical protein